MAKRKRLNPFYALLVIVGLAFVVTAFAYGFMAFQQVNAVRAEAGRHAGHPLFQWLRTNGDQALVIELIAMALFTGAAIGTDRQQDEAERERREFDAISEGK
jgi:hypothetical protein